MILPVSEEQMKIRPFYGIAHKTQSNGCMTANWTKSSISAANGDCVEVASLSEGFIGIRDSKNVRGPVLRFTPNEWNAFVGGVRLGEFDNILERNVSP
jgi:hypothetical protein